MHETLRFAKQVIHNCSLGESCPAIARLSGLSREHPETMPSGYGEVSMGERPECYVGNILRPG